jgi:D-3-phosphoglycerate dehydrogenase
MFKIKTYNAISTKGLSRFSRESYEVASEIGHADAYMLRSHKLHGEVLPETVKAVGRAGAGTNNVPVDDYSKKGVVVFNAPGANANAVKELVMTGMLLASRGIVPGMDYVKTLSGMTDAEEMGKLCEKEKKNFAGSELMGKTLGVVGLGAIGSMVADMALGFGMNVIGFDPALSVDGAWKLPSAVKRAENLQSLLSNCDYVTIHVPAIAPTLNMINEDSLKSAKAGQVLLNFARESIVNSEAVAANLDSEGGLRQYICDFPHPSLMERDDVYIMPHIGASTAEAEENCAIMVADQLMDYLENGNIKNSVNFPLVVMDRAAGANRITFTNNNVSGVLGDVLAILSSNSVNVVDMVNKSRGDLAYSIIDLESAPSSDVVSAIAGTEHVINVRVL